MKGNMHSFDFRELETRVMASVQALLVVADITPTTCLLGQQGVLDSVTTVALIVELEQEFGISIGDEDLTLENLSNVTQIATFLMNKLHEGEIKL
ncbi:acyl carrier protein [Paenibacillus sp. GCM10027626]|uniref:acyl carrier protein n=1 Tax=Paenibacillus sp. GCM10027626 TaxID=3273411 RepID=UPI0036356658